MTYRCPVCQRSFAEPGFCPFDGKHLAAVAAADQPTVLTSEHKAPPGLLFGLEPFQQRCVVGQGRRIQGYALSQLLFEMRLAMHQPRWEQKRFERLRFGQRQCLLVQCVGANQGPVQIDNQGRDGVEFNHRLGVHAPCNVNPACSRSGWKWILGKRSCASRTS